MVSAQRAVDGESTAGKCTVEWTSEGEQKRLSICLYVSWHRTLYGLFILIKRFPYKEISGDRIPYYRILAGFPHDLRFESEIRCRI